MTRSVIPSPKVNWDKDQLPALQAKAWHGARSEDENDCDDWLSAR